VRGSAKPSPAGVPGHCPTRALAWPHGRGGARHAPCPWGVYARSTAGERHRSVRRRGVQPRLPTAFRGVAHGAIMGRKPCRRHGLRRAPESTRAWVPDGCRCGPPRGPPAALSLSATRSPWACLMVSPGGHAHLSARRGTMARAAEDRRLTGIERHQGAPAPEPPRVPRIALTFSGLPPAAGHTIVTRERGMARQILGHEVQIEGSSLLMDGGPDDRAQHHRGSWHEDVQPTKKPCRLCMAQRPEEATRPP
jgi:hypothetical protein